MIRFDVIDDWEPRLAAALRPHVPQALCEQIRVARPRFIEDARDMLLNGTSHQTIIEATLEWLGSGEVAGYHGTRLTEDEADAVRAEGLVPLRAEMRVDRLARALSAHPMWPEALRRLPAAIDSHGRGGAAGVRENQVHLTLSRAGLTESFNHYLEFGSEFDQQVAHALLGDEGRALLAADGVAMVVEVAVPGSEALKAAHPYFGIDDMLRRGELPNLVGEFLAAWAYRQADQSYQCRRLKLDCGMIFRSTVPAAWIRSIDPHLASPEGDNG